MNRTVFLFSVMLLFSCSRTGEKMEVIGVVESAEWYTSSIGFSRMGAKGYFKQKVIYYYSVGDTAYEGEFENGPEIGALEMGDSLKIQYPNGNPENSTVIGRHKIGRKKHKPVHGEAW